MGERPARPALHRRGTGPSRGPLASALAALMLAAAVAVVGRPLAVDAVVAQAREHDTLLRQAIVRAIVAERVREKTDVPADPRASPQSFVIARGETAGEIARHLEAAGVVRSALAFTFVLYDGGSEASLQAGTYTVSAAFTPRELARLFQQAPGEQVVLRIIEGWRLSEIAAAVNKALPTISREAFLATAVVGERQSPSLAGLDKRASLEGLLFPDTYFLRPDATAADVVETLLANFESRAGATLRTGATQRKTSVYDLVKLASLVERETRDRAESPTIAGVYANRLAIGMKLDADPTVQYALGDWRPLTLGDLSLDSPFNTYRVAGLPPTPICSPGLAALAAAARPADVPYFYFVAKNDGSGDHAFATTLEEHEANRAKYGNK